MVEASPAQERPTVSERKPFEMIRSFTPADLVTLSNAACGTGTLFICLNYIEQGANKAFLWPAFVLLPLALVFDIADGTVARKTGRTSAIGADLDSLADVISFGVAPAVLGFTLGLRGGWDIAILLFFVLCGVSRLARFNATADDLDDGTGKVTHFEGTPIPASLILVGVLGVLLGLDLVGTQALPLGSLRVGWLFHPLSVMYIISGSLMISRIKIPKP